jgi:hypothetical protein
MQVSLWSAEHQVTLMLKVKKIEAQAIYKSDGDDDLFDDYYRSIRFITLDGDVIDVNCSAYNEKALAIVEVATLLPLNKADSQGTSDRENV